MKLPEYNPEYNADAGPAEYEHRGGDECPTHGPNVPHFRLKDSIGPFYCVACAQEMAATQAAEPPVSAVVPKLNGHPADLPGNGRADAATIDRLHNELQSAHAAHAIATAENERLQRQVVELEASRQTHLDSALRLSEQLDAHRRTIVELEAKAALAAHWRAHAESVRVARWHATFNACMGPSAGDEWTEKYVAAARKIADEIHGPLPSKEGA